MKTPRPPLKAGSLIVIALASFAAGIWAQGTAGPQTHPKLWRWPDSQKIDDEAIRGMTKYPAE